MNKRDVTTAIVDNVLQTVVISGSIASVLVLPNLAQALDKPVQKYLNRLDKRARER